MEVFSWIGRELLQGAMPILATAIAGMVVALLRKQLAKVGIIVTKEQEDRMRELAKDAVLAIEERNARAVKDGGKPMTSEQKAGAAFDLVVDKMPKAPAADVGRAIDAALPKMRSFLGKGSFPVPSTPGSFGRRE